jgi:ApaG protein
MVTTMPTSNPTPLPHQFSVSVQPQYLPEQSDPAQNIYSFSYTVTITNTGLVSAQLIARHWVVSDASGHTEEIKGLAVVGHQPLLKPGESFQYTSGTRLRAPHGSMHGSYFCVAEDGHRFDAAIPAFVLDAGGDSPRVLH